MVTQIPGGELTPVEQALVERVERGERLDLSYDDRTADQATMRSWDVSRTCRASVIRDILTGKLVSNPDPRGLWLRGARIVGRLDLEGVNTDLPLVLTNCFLEEGVLLRNARLASVALTRCQIEHPSDPNPRVSL